MNRLKLDLEKIDINDTEALLKIFGTDLECEPLKKWAIDYIRRIGGKKWTDYSPHDPGITILEELCYAITDIDFRIDFKMDDLIAENPNEINNITYFHKPEEIFPCSPITVSDYRKIILDVPGVRNCSIIPVKEKGKIKGLYDVYLYLEFDDEKEKERIIDNVSVLLNKNRNIGEDFNKIKLFEILDVSIDLLIEVNEGLDKDQTFSFDNFAAELLSDIQNFFIPYNNFISLSEAYAKDKNLENVFNGPILNHGFIDNEVDGNIKNEYLIFNIINFLTQKDKVKKVKNIEIRDVVSGEIFSRQIKLRLDQVVRVIFKKCKVTFIDRNRIISTNENIVTSLAKRFNMYQSLVRKENDEEFDFYRGEYKNLYQFYSIQNGLPSVYGTTEDGIRHDNDNAEKILQLKGFLLFFDIHLAQYLTFVDQLKHNLSIHSSHNCSKDFQFPDNIYELKKILRRPNTFDRSINFIDREFCIQKKFIVKDKIEIDSEENKFLVNSCTNYVNKILERVTNKDKRKNIVYHLLARYSEGEDAVNNPYVVPEKLLENYPTISKNRAKASYFLRNDEIFDSKNISTFEYKFCCYFNIKNPNRRLLHFSFLDNFSMWSGLKKQQQQQGKIIDSEGVTFNGKFTNIFYLVLKYGGNIDNYIISNINDLKMYEVKLFIDDSRTKFLSLAFKNKEMNYNLEKINTLLNQISKNIRNYNINTEGIHCIEHIMLRTDNNKKDHDVISNRITIVFPDWPLRFQDKIFRMNVENWIAKELPVHIKANILWLNMENMKNVEYNYKHWLSVKKSSSYDKEKVDTAAEALLNILLKLHSEQQY